jgi:hypothetical protein
MSSRSGGVNLLHLYRVLVKKAKVFPSKNRAGILREIRTDFRKNKNLTDPDKIAKCVAVAVKGVEQLSMYTDLNKSSSHWVVNLDQNPMPKPETFERKADRPQSRKV